MSVGFAAFLQVLVAAKRHDHVESGWNRVSPGVSQYLLSHFQHIRDIVDALYKCTIFTCLDWTTV